MKVCKLTLDGMELTTDQNDIGYTGAADYVAELNIITPHEIEGMVKMALITTSIKDKTSIQCDVLWDAEPIIIKVPDVAYAKEGRIWLSIAGFANDKRVFSSSPVTLYVEKSNPTIIVEREQDVITQQLIMDCVDQYMKNTVFPDIENMMEIANQQQESIDKMISEINDMVENGSFRGSQILNGEIDPIDSDGKDKDIYINNLSWHVFYKESGVWIDKGSIKGEGASGGGKIKVGETLKTAQDKELFIETETSDVESDVVKAVAHIDVDGNMIFSGDTGNILHSGELLKDFINLKMMKAPNGYTFSERGVIKLKEINIDEVSLPGKYYCDSCTGLPENRSYYLDVAAHPTSDLYAYQHIIDVNYKTEFVRNKIGSWSEWRQLTESSASVLYQNGWQANGMGAVLVRIGSVVLFSAVMRNGINTTNTTMASIPKDYWPQIPCNVALITSTGNGLATVMLNGNIVIATPAPDKSNVQIVSIWLAA